MHVPYEKQTLDNPNPIARFAHRARFKKSKRLVAPFLGNGSTLVDYGCGQGRFLSELTIEADSTGRQITLLGYDPFMAAQYPGYSVVSDPEMIPTASADIVTCLEVCEHLNDAEMLGFVNFARRILKPNGKVLVSVPIMIGPAVLLKEVCRSILFRRRSDTPAGSLLKAAFFGTPPRRAEDIKVSHRGYDWRVTRAVLTRNFDLAKLEFSPLPLIGWYGNSQAIMLLTKPTD